MPYIEQSRRLVINEYLAAVREGVNKPSGSEPQNSGELNFALTMACLRHDRVKFASLDYQLDRIAFEFLHDPANPLRYQRINDLSGACENAALELERRCPSTRRFEIATLRYIARKHYNETAVAYEKRKIAENGDIAEYGDKQ